jgi:OOP family OmpA-OmpF porin
MTMRARFIVPVLGAVLCLASFGLGGSPALALSAGHDGPDFVYNSKEAIGEAQGILQHLGLLKSGSYQRGILDEATRGALLSFQRTHTLTPTAQVDGETLAALLQHRPPADSDGDGVPDTNDRCPNTPEGVKVDSRGCPTDADGDGVPDDRDRCPDTPRGTKVNSDGCPADADGDGVPDDRDRCPDTPRGTKVNSDGCPADTDGDGVTDDRDRCPDTPRGTKVDSRGCPEQAEAAAPVVTKTALVLEGVNFETNSARLTGDSTPVLDRVADSLKAHPDVRVEIAGYTDSTGSASVNRRLSKARADSVRDYLAAHGVAASRMETQGYGPDNPIADNKTTAGRAKNRRVEMKRID